VNKSDEERRKDWIVIDGDLVRLSFLQGPVIAKLGCTVLGYTKMDIQLHNPVPHISTVSAGRYFASTFVISSLAIAYELRINTNVRIMN